MRNLRWSLWLETPTLARSLGVSLVLAVLGITARAAADGDPPIGWTTLGEVDVIRLAEARSPTARVATANVELADARSRTAGLLPNPTLSWERETVQSGPVEAQGSEDTVVASLPIDVARASTSRSLAASDAAWTRAEASLARTTSLLEAILAYYDAVLAERRVELASRAVSNLEEAARVLERREAEGSASGYESTRLAIASELSRSRLAEAVGEAASARARLGVLLGLRPEAFRVSHELVLISPAEAAAIGRARTESPPGLLEAHESIRRAAEAEDHAALAWFPTVELGGGVKRANDEGAGSGYGYVVGVSLGIPLFDRGQARREEARARQALAIARAEALKRAFDADFQSGLATFRTAREELLRFEAQTSAHVDVLLTAARSGYREGERTIVELLDAQRADVEVAERRLELLGKAKLAEARLRAAAGALR